MASGTIQLVDKGSASLTLPSGTSVESITVKTPPGVPGSATPYTETVTWQQTQARRWIFSGQWKVTITWDVTVPHELTYSTS